MQFFHQKTILITGASSGIGLEIVKILLTLPCKIICVDIASLPENLAKSSQVYFYQTDLTQPENLDFLFEKLTSDFEKIDIFIANAGFAYYEHLQNPDWEHLQKIFALNVFSPIYSLLKMRKINENIVFCITASAMAKMGLAGYSLYSATKAALDRFTEAFRLENPTTHLVVVYPIATRTNFFENAGKAPLYFPSQSAKKVAQSILKGIAKGKKRIFPSFLFKMIYFLGFLQEGINRVYQKYTQRIFYKHFEQVFGEKEKKS
ncbi:MAG: SDR family NAD(P)-dependent oxidoreductase [Raineya sp.]|nr:SDR family NAD(P)-dependent oxidoreductase [Raineya sp.]MDW8295381.1 SDR family NAD(P)-dependent oxidoreductase [Raineya sp.]